MLKKQRIVITGAAGNNGGKLKEAFKEMYDLVLFNRNRDVSGEILLADLSVYDPLWAEHFAGAETEQASLSARGYVNVSAKSSLSP